jgi:hypothetical protein
MMEGAATSNDEVSAVVPPSSPKTRSRVNSMTQQPTTPGSVRISAPPKSLTKRVPPEVNSKSSPKTEQLGSQTPLSPSVGQAVKLDNFVASPKSSVQVPPSPAIEHASSLKSARVSMGTEPLSGQPPAPAVRDSRALGDASPPVPSSIDPAKTGGVVRSVGRPNDAGQASRPARPAHGQPLGHNAFFRNSSMPRSSSHAALGRPVQAQRVPVAQSPQHSGFSSRGFVGASFYGSVSIP